jgi:N-methylhydantoinase A
VLSGPVEIVGWKVEASGPAPGTFSTAVPVSEAPRGAATGMRRAFFPSLGGFIECNVYKRERLAPGTCIEGPALVEEAESTSLLDAGDRAIVDPSFNLVADIGAAA